MNNITNHEAYDFELHTSYLNQLLHNLALSNDHQGNLTRDSVLPYHYPLRRVVAPSYATNPSLNRYNYQGPSIDVHLREDFGLLNEDQFRSETLNYAPNLSEWPVIGNGIDMRNYCPYGHSPSVSSSIDNNGYNMQFSGLYPSNGGPKLDNHDNSSQISQIVLEHFFEEPFVTMISPSTNRVLKKLLDNNNKVINVILRKVIEIPDVHLSYACRYRPSMEFMRNLIIVAKKLPRISELPKKLARMLPYLMNHKDGHYVIMECCKHLNAYKNEPLYEEMIKHWSEMAYDKYGCITLQCGMSHMQPIGHYATFSKMDLLTKIKRNAAILAKSDYGIFVLQHVVPMNIDSYDEEIVEQLKPIFWELCVSKSGSFLVEKYVETPFRSIIAKELLKTTNSSLVRTIANHCFGNYVIKKLLIQTKEHDPCMYERLSKILLKDLAHLECSPHGSHIAKLLKDQIMGCKSGRRCH